MGGREGMGVGEQGENEGGKADKQTGKLRGLVDVWEGTAGSGDERHNKRSANTSNGAHPDYGRLCTTAALGGDIGGLYKHHADEEHTEREPPPH